MPPAAAADTPGLRAQGENRGCADQPSQRGKGGAAALQGPEAAALWRALGGRIASAGPAPASGTAACGLAGKAPAARRRWQPCSWPRTGYTGRGRLRTAAGAARPARPSGQQLAEQRVAPLRPWRSATTLRLRGRHCTLRPDMDATTTPWKPRWAGWFTWRCRLISIGRAALDARQPKG